MKYKKASRKTVVEGTKIAHLRPDDPLFPHSLFDANGEAAADIWYVFVTLRTGLLPARNWTLIARSADAAEALAAKYAIGAGVDEMSDLWGDMFKSRDFISNLVDAGLAPGASGAGDGESPLAFEVLADAGIRSFGSGLSQSVVDYLGAERISALEATHNDNWGVAAAFEYCFMNLPHSSPAYVAAAYQFHYYISGDDFKAGYLWRDLECIVHGVEAEASKAIEMRRNAGLKGRDASERARKRRIEALLVGMEAIAERNPDIAVLGSKSLAALGLGHAMNADASLWRQGQGQVDEYLGEMRRGEAGEALKVRFLALLPGKPPRRS